MAQDIRMPFARLLRDKQDELALAQAQWAKAARALTRMLADGALAIDQFDLHAFDAAAQDIRQATANIRPIQEEVQELKARLL